MKVYVIEYNRFEDSEVIKVLSDKQKALAFCSEKNKAGYDEWISYTYSEFEVE